MHRFIICECDILTLDNAQERREAREAIRAAGLASLPILEGEPGEPGEETGEILTAADAPPPEDLPTAETFAEMLSVMVNPEADECERMDVIGGITGCGRVEIRTFRSAGILTDNEGFVIKIGRAEFQVTVVDSSPAY
jgi:hypothetical protein